MTIRVFEVDPAEYRKLLEPFESVEDANDAAREFYREVRAIRLKYGIPDVTVVSRFNAIDAGRERITITTQHHGYEVHAPEMLRVASEQVVRMIGEAARVTAQKEPEAEPFAPPTRAAANPDAPAIDEPAAPDIRGQSIIAYFGRELVKRDHGYELKNPTTSLQVTITPFMGGWIASAQIDGDHLHGVRAATAVGAIIHLQLKVVRLSKSIKGAM